MNEDSNSKIDIVKLLQDGNAVQITPSGYSMYPFLVSGRDYAVLIPVYPEEIKRGDVCLYRRDDGKLVLHRVFRVDDSGIYMIGDYQQWVEGPLCKNQFIGRMTEFTRHGKKHSVTESGYRMYADLWLKLYRKRQFLIRNMRRVCKVLHVPLTELKS